MKPFGYVVCGMVIGTALGIILDKLTAPDFPISVLPGAILGAIGGYALERLAIGSR
jgi:hypothetical protein